MPTFPLPPASPATAPALAALPGASLRRHGLYLAAITAYFRATRGTKPSRPAPLPIVAGSLPPLRSI